MSKNINQLPDAVSLQNADKMYLGRSPFGVTNDFAITGSEIIAAAPVQSVNGQTGAVTGLIDTAGTGLTKTSTTLSITNTLVTPASYGNATNVGSFQVNQQGQITNASNVPIAIPSSQVTNFNTSADARITNAVTTNVVQAYGANTQGLNAIGNTFVGPLALTGVSGGITTYHTPIGSQTSATTFNNISNTVSYGDVVDFTSGSTKTFTLDYTSLNVGYYFYITNSGSGILNFTPTGGQTIYGYTRVPGGGGTAPTTALAKVEVIFIGGAIAWHVSVVNDFNVIAGTNISLSRAATGLTINSSGIASFAWNDITGTSQTMAANQGYLSDNASLVTLTLPTTIAQLSIIEVAGNGAGGWQIAQNASQVINFNSASTTVGVGGSIASTNRYNSCKLLCTVANTTFTLMAPSGTLTVV